MADSYEFGDDRATLLSQLPDVGVTGDSPDVRGWAAVASDQQEIGKISDLLVDTDAMQARYLVVDLTNPRALGHHEARVLVPASSTRLDEVEHKVHVGIPSMGVATLPPLSSYPSAGRHTGATPITTESVADSAPTGSEARDADDTTSVSSAERLRFGRRTPSRTRRLRNP